jgi:glycerol-3-phosphate dehydrogenase
MHQPLQNQCNLQDSDSVFLFPHQSTPLQGQTRLNVRKTPRQGMDKVKAVELQIAVSMACHFAISTVDHLSEIMTAHGHGSTLEHMQLHRSK